MAAMPRAGRSVISLRRRHERDRRSRRKAASALVTVEGWVDASRLCGQARHVPGVGRPKAPLRVRAAAVGERGDPRGAASAHRGAARSASRARGSRIERRRVDSRRARCPPRCAGDRAPERPRARRQSLRRPLRQRRPSSRRPPPRPPERSRDGCREGPRSCSRLRGARRWATWSDGARSCSRSRTTTDSRRCGSRAGFPERELLPADDLAPARSSAPPTFARIPRDARARPCSGRSRCSRCRPPTRCAASSRVTSHTCSRKGPAIGESRCCISPYRRRCSTRRRRCRRSHAC